MLLETLQLRMALQQLIDLLFVLSRVNRACGINEATPRRQQRQKAIEKIFLQGQHFINRSRGDPPASIGMASQGSKTGTGSIHEDSLKTALPAGTIVLKRSRIRRQGRNRVQPKPCCIGGNPLKSPRRPVHGPDFTVVVDQLRQMGALATGSCTGIKDAISRHGLQQGGHPLSRAVLHTPVA